MNLGTLYPTDDTRAGRMLSAGSLVATITSKRTGQHVTLRLKASVKNEGGHPRWPRVAFEHATHVFIDDYDGERVATYYPKRGYLWIEQGVTEAARWTVLALLKYLAGVSDSLERQAELVEADLCGACGLELTDPVSVERGLGPTCFGKHTNSKAAQMHLV